MVASRSRKTGAAWTAAILNCVTGVTSAIASSSRRRPAFVYRPEIPGALLEGDSCGHRGALHPRDSSQRFLLQDVECGEASAGPRRCQTARRNYGEKQEKAWRRAYEAPTCAIAVASFVSERFCCCSEHPTYFRLGGGQRAHDVTTRALNGPAPIIPGCVS